MQSIWSEGTQLPSFLPLREELHTDVLIIGGGITGLLCAWMLGQAGVDYVLVEADRICRGVTAKTTAKITAQHGLIYDRLIREWGEELASMYLKANCRALEAYRILGKQIPCSFEERDSYVYSRQDQGALERELRALEKLHYDARFADALGLPFSVVGSVRFPCQVQFHPLQFAAGLAKDLRIYEQTRVISVKGQEAITAEGKRIKASNMIFATHFPIINTHGLYFMKLYQQRSYVLALEKAPLAAGMFREDLSEGLSFRTAGNLTLVGGGGHRTGKMGGGYEELRRFAANYYPKAIERACWATQDCMSLDKIPYIGRYGGKKQAWYVATGFSKWGMTSAMAAAQILRDMILEKENDCAQVFSPARHMRKSRLMANAMEAAADLMTFGKKRCPHMGCTLQYNSAEHSWDCPCHGSRFSEEGKLLENPALRDLKK